MRINTNISAMNAHRQLSINTQNGQKSMEKLSSGLRINRAGDDAAGLAISEKMRGQIRGLTQATRNAQDGISLIQTAEGALNESHSILQRMRELAVQSATDTNTADDRAEIQKEVDQLAAELTRIGETTEFNTQKLLDGNYEGKFHIGANEGQNMDITIGDMRADALGVSGDGIGSGTFELAATSAAASNNGDNLAGTGLEEGEQTLKVVEIDNVTIADGKTANYGLANEDGEIVATSQDGKTYHLLDGAYKTNELSDASAVHADDTIVFAEKVISGDVTLEAAADGTLSNTTASSASIEVEGLATGTYTAVDIGDANYADYFTGDGIAVGDNWAHGSIEQVLLNDDGDVVAVRLNDSVENVVAGEFYALDDIDFSVDYAGGATGAVAADADPVMTTANLADGDTLTVRAEGGIDVSTQEAADKAISVIDNAISAVSAERSALGANQNRLEHTIANLGTSAENLAAAESRIRDVDMAAEMMEFTKSNILNQASTAMLAQANLAPQNVLQLLG